MRVPVTIILLIISSAVYSQELNLGLLVGTDLGANRYGIVTYGPTIEFRPLDAIFSVNSDLQISHQEHKTYFTIPAYIKVMFGESFKVGPSFGGFITGHKAYGFVLGLSMDARFSKKYCGFINTVFFKGYSNSNTPRGEIIDNWNAYMISIGLRYNIIL